MEGRNRASGWQHAKITGHENEELVAELVLNETEVKNRLLKCAHIDNYEVVKIEVGGIHEKNVPSIFGDTTKSKTDIVLALSNNQRLNISIKKDEGGQVYLTTIEHFIYGFEIQYNKIIPNDVKRAIELYFGFDRNIPGIVKECDSPYSDYELRKNRLTAETLKVYDYHLYIALLEWFKENSFELFDFCFSKGAAKNREDWADIVWYRNLIGENSFDTMICLSDLAKYIPKDAYYGNVNGGTTIQLPFGFVQWHSPRKVIPGCIQFHHNYQRILEIYNIMTKNQY